MKEGSTYYETFEEFAKNEQMDVNFIIIAVSPQDAITLVNDDFGKQIKILHAVFYENKPTDEDFKELTKELKTDEEIKLTEEFVLLLCPEYFKNNLLETLNAQFQQN